MDLPEITCSAVYPTLAVPHVAQTCDWYVTKLGFKLRFLWGEPATHGAVQFGEASIHFWEGPAQLGLNWIYFDITNVDALHDRLRVHDVDIAKPPQNYPWGMRELNIVDLNGYNVRFGQHVGQ